MTESRNPASESEMLSSDPQPDAAPPAAPGDPPKGPPPDISVPGEVLARAPAAPPPPPPPRTKWTRRVPHPVLIGHAASLTAPPPRTADRAAGRGSWGRSKTP